MSPGPMRIAVWRALSSAVLIAIVGLTSAAAAQAPGRIALAPCTPPGLAPPVRCGTLSVSENRATKTGRTIALFVAVLPASGRDRAPDPVFAFAGGPGQASTEMGDFVNALFRLVRPRRDIVLVDLRGTGRSAPLQCLVFRSSEDLVGDFYPLPNVRLCRDSLAARADLRQYTTSIMMDDVDDVRAALGYDRINIYGTSYGTRAALVYARRHPDHVRSLVLKSIAPTTMRAPMTYARDAQGALDSLFADCAAERACHAAFPHLAQDLASVLARAERGELRVARPDSAPGSTHPPLRFSRGAIVTTLMSMLQSTSASAQLPSMIHRAAQGDLSPLVQADVQIRRGLAQGISYGMHLSVMCAEDTPFLDTLAAARDNHDTFLGDYRVRQQVAACREWVRGAVPADYASPVRSDAPALLISGSLDPNTPPSLAAEAARTLPNSRQIVFRNVAHSFSAVRDCGDGIIAAFIERPSPHGTLDLGCVARVRRPPFAIP